jgi:hypothetical protein
VWDPVAELPAGRERLAAVCARWIELLEHPAYPGGCFLTTAATEWDGRAGPVRDAVQRAQARWLRVLRAEAEVGVRAGELPLGTDPDQLVFELNGLAMSLNQSIQLASDTRAGAYARRAVARMLGKPLVS